MTQFLRVSRDVYGVDRLAHRVKHACILRTNTKPLSHHNHPNFKEMKTYLLYIGVYYMQLLVN